MQEKYSPRMFPLDDEIGQCFLPTWNVSEVNQQLVSGHFPAT